MNRNKRRISQSNTIETIPVGMAKLALAYQERNADVGQIILKRGREIHEYAVDKTVSDIVTIRAQFRSVEITVSCIAPLTSDTREILQARTHYAAIAAVDWVAVPTQLHLLQSNSL